ncbi:hypothetical protein EMCRGX_G032952 [Ephydatia muelleri]|eukprot:Em0019g985a
MFWTGVQNTVTVFLALIIQCTVSDWLLEIKLGSYSNPSSTKEDGQCCDSGPVANCSQDARCDNVFCLLLQPHGAGYLPPGTVACLFYIQWSQNIDNIQFGSTLYTRTPNSYLENPLVVMDSGAYPQYELVLIVQDQDTVCIAYVNYCYTYQEPVDEIYINFAVHPSSNFTVINATTGRYQRGTITISVRLTCSPHWYGQDCGTFCMPQNNSKFICNNDGNKACLKGWNGTNCSEAICSDGCAVPTQAFCDVPDQCICLPGWSGAQCTHCIPHEGCSSIGGYCLLPYQCLCHENHTGDNCDISVDNSSSLHTAIQGNRSHLTAEIIAVLGSSSIALALLVATLVLSIIVYLKHQCRVRRVIIITNKHISRTEVAELDET